MSFFPELTAATYADESDDQKCFVLSCVSIPISQIREPASEWDRTTLTNDWQYYFEEVKKWRLALRDNFGIPIKKELKGSKLATGRNSYQGGRAPIYGSRAIEVYKSALQTLDFLPDKSIFSVSAVASYNMYGHRKLQAALYAMFQRLQRQMAPSKCKIMIFFDEGHAEYRTLFRKACVHMPTGSARGAWQDGSRSKSIPLSCTIEDANFKDSKSSWFIQIADLIAYATLVKLRGERGDLSEKEIRLGSASLHDSIPRRVLNVKVVTNGNDAIVRLK